MTRKVCSFLISFSLIFQQIGFASIATELNIAGHLSRMSGGIVTDNFRPVHIRFFSYDAAKDNIKVMLDKGDVKNINENQLSASSQELLKYFQVGLSLPNDKFWVNLRPDSEDQIIDQYLEKTDVGRVMLEADLQLKKDTAQFTSPATPEGREYWEKLYKKAGELYGYEEVSIPTLTRPWIVPNEIIVRESKDSAYIYKATLKVMLEQDYLKDSATYSFKDERSKALNEYSSQLIRELIIPKLTKEVNLSKRYAALRQVYYSIILSRWFKSRFSGQAGKYASSIDQKDLTGLISAEAWSKTTYFEAYKKSFAQGEYNIKETVRTPTGQVIRSYFSGGVVIPPGLASSGLNVGEKADPAFGVALEKTLGASGQKLSGSPVTASPSIKDESGIDALARELAALSKKSGVNITGNGQIVPYEAFLSPKAKIAFGQFIKGMSQKNGGSDWGIVIPKGYSLEDLKKMLFSAAITIEPRKINDLKNAVEADKIDSAMMVVDWNIKRKDLAKGKFTRITDSTDAIISTFNLGLQFVYLMTHAERPQEEKDSQVRLDNYNLGPIVAKADEVLHQKGLNAEVVRLPFDLDEAEKVIKEKKATANGKKILFVFENIRLYPQEQLAADKKATGAEKAEILKTRKAFEMKLISLTGKSVNDLVYISEAFDKAHRGEEASMEMAWLFPEQNRAAGPKFAKDIQSVLNFQLRISGSLNAMFGGAKFDKYDQFGKLADAIAKSKGKLMIVGAQINPYIKDQGKETGKSILPNEKDQKKVDKGLEAIKKSGVQVLLPEDLIVQGKDTAVALDALTMDDAQIDIGDQAIKQDVNYINSLQAGDGLILNGGAGVFDQEWGSKTGTITLVVAANEAAKRGVSVICAGGDMYKAVQMVIKEVSGFKLADNIEISTGGGSLLTALAQGIANFASVRAILKLDAEEALYSLHDTAKESFPNGLILPTFCTLPEDTSIDGNDANRKAALDLFKGYGIYIAVPDGSFATSSKLFYDYVIMPMVVLGETLPADFKEKLAGAKDEKAVTTLVQDYLGGYFKNQGINIAATQERSHKLDVGKLGALAVDLSSLIAIKTESNDLFIHIPVWVKRDHNAMESLNKKIVEEMENQKSILATLYKAPLAWPKENPDITDSTAALKMLAQYSPLFFSEFSKGDLTHAALLADAIKKIEPQTIINVNGIKYDPLLGVFISEKDVNAKLPGFGNNLEKFLSQINSIQQLSFLLYILTTPNIDQSKQAVVAVNSIELQDNVISFYGRMYRYLISLAQENFDDVRVFEPLRAEIGSYAQKLNQSIRSNDALELNAATAEAVTSHLIQKGVLLSQAEKDNLLRVYSKTGGIFAYDILQMASILSEDNFIAAFRNLKVDVAKKVLPSEKPYSAYDGTGRICTNGLALRLAGDINARETGYIGRYLVRTRSLKGNTAEEKLAAALASAQKIFADQVIRDSGVEVLTREGGLVPMADLIDSNRIIFNPGSEVLSAQLDFQTNALVPSVYPVNILLDNQRVAVIYFTDIAQFNGEVSKKFAGSGDRLDNIPRPAIIQEKDGKTYYFALLTDVTPGGVEIGDQTLVKAAEAGKAKLSGPTVWEMAAKYDLAFNNDQLTDKEELERLRELLGQIEKTRLSPGENQFFIYLKAQIAKKLLLPLGGGVHFVGRYMQKLPFVKSEGAMYFTPMSCSTNGGTYGSFGLSTLFGGFGNNPLTILGTTFHMYTTGDRKGDFGHFNPKSTGAAKGVKQALKVNALFTALRTPTGTTDGSVDIVGGSIFDLLIQLPENVPEDLVRNALVRIGVEFPEILKIFNEDHKVDSRYRWQDTIAGLRTGSILYSDFINQIMGNVYRMAVGYDNEMSYTFKMTEFLEQLFLLMSRQKDIGKIIEAAPLVNTQTGASSAIRSIAEITPVNIRDTFGKYKPFTAGELAAKANIVDIKAVGDKLENIWLKSDNIAKSRIAGQTVYQYTPISVAVQIGPDTEPEDVQDASIVVINHSETKEFLGVTAASARKQLDKFLKSGFKVILAFGDFPAKLYEANGEVKNDYLASGLRKFPTAIKEIEEKLKSLNISNPNYTALNELYNEAQRVQNSSFDSLQINFGDYVSLFGISDINQLDTLKEKIISELSTKVEIESELQILFEGLSRDDIIHRIYKAYEPIEGIKTVAIPYKLAEFRYKYIRKFMAEVTKINEADLEIVYGGGGNVKNIGDFGKVYKGAFIGRASALAAADEGKDSTANISESAQKSKQESGKKLVTIYNAKSTRAAKPNEYLDAYTAKALDVEEEVKIIHALSLLDYRAFQEALKGNDVTELFKDISKSAPTKEITILATGNIGTKGVGAYTAHIPAEFLREAGVTQAVIDPAKKYAVTQVKNFAAAGITSIILRDGDNQDITKEFMQKIGPANFDKFIFKNAGDVTLTPINEVRQSASSAVEAIPAEIIASARKAFTLYSTIKNATDTRDYQNARDQLARLLEKHGYSGIDLNQLFDQQTLITGDPVKKIQELINGVQASSAVAKSTWDGFADLKNREHISIVISPKGAEEITVAKVSHLVRMQPAINHYTEDEFQDIYVIELEPEKGKDKIHFALVSGEKSVIYAYIKNKPLEAGNNKDGMYHLDVKEAIKKLVFRVSDEERKISIEVSKDWLEYWNGCKKNQLIPDTKFKTLGGYTVEFVSASSAVQKPGGIDGSADPLTINSKQKVGGIDFKDKAMMINYQPMGNFAGLNLKPVVLSKAELARFDIDKELAQLEAMASSGIVPSGERIEELEAACSQKGEMEARRPQVLALLIKVGIMQETQCCLEEASPGFKKALVLADSLA